MIDTGKDMDLTLAIIRKDGYISEGNIIPYDQRGDPTPQSGIHRYPIMFEKYFLDGSIGSRTASFSFDYTDSARKEPLITEKELEAQVGRSVNEGVVPMVHCIGDSAIELAIRVLERTRSIYRLEHAEMMTNDRLELMTRGKGSLCLQPNFPFLWEGIDGLYERSLGSHYSSLNPFRSISNSGVDWCFGTDLMPPGPLFALKGAISHPVAEHRISRNIALNGFIERSRRMSFPANIEEKCFKVGSKADLIYLNESFSEVIMTFLNGKCIHNNTNSMEP
jgi:predicted amidohydrolase YtcJ